MRSDRAAPAYIKTLGGSGSRPGCWMLRSSQCCLAMPLPAEIRAARKPPPGAGSGALCRRAAASRRAPLLAPRCTTAGHARGPRADAAPAGSLPRARCCGPTCRRAAGGACIAPRRCWPVSKPCRSGCSCVQGRPAPASAPCPGARAAGPAERLLVLRRPCGSAQSPWPRPQRPPTLAAFASATSFAYFTMVLRVGRDPRGRCRRARGVCRRAERRADAAARAHAAPSRAPSPLLTLSSVCSDQFTRLQPASSPPRASSRHRRSSAS